jgi:Family of unknown function (DUF5808)
VRAQTPEGCVKTRERGWVQEYASSRSKAKEHGMSAASKPSRTGTFLGVPYDWRRQGFKARLKQRWWNPAEPRLITPRAFGWGYALNFARLFRRSP